MVSEKPDHHSANSTAEFEPQRLALLVVPVAIPESSQGLNYRPWLISDAVRFNSRTISSNVVGPENKTLHLDLPLLLLVQPDIYYSHNRGFHDPLRLISSKLKAVCDGARLASWVCWHDDE